MAGTIRPDTLAVSTGTPVLSSKTLPTPSSSSKQSTKPTVTAPRIDVEPLYTALKSAVGDAHWSTYKAAISAFMLGNLNQTELTLRLAPILTTPALEHAHNQFIFAIYGNIFRDPPEPGVATWVSANDKPTTTTKPAGDEAEKRLKHEVMQLNRRERKRLKTIPEGHYDGFTEMMTEYHNARTIKLPDTGPASAGGFQKTNWDLEIRKRYTQPLFTETHEFPDTESISARMLPICYENGLPAGSSASCASFMNIATETYIKEALSNFFSRVSSNGDKYIKTASYKRALERDEERVARGEITRSAGGFLPAEVEEIRKRPPLGMEDIRLALELGDSYLGQVPLISGGIANGRFLDFDGVEEVQESQNGSTAVSTVANRTGAAAAVTGVGVSAAAAVLQQQPFNSSTGSRAGASAPNNSFQVDLGDPMVLDDEWGWQGGQVGDLEGLDSVLDGCLAVGV